MKKFIKNNFKNLMLATITIGKTEVSDGYEINVPLLKDWTNFDDIKLEVFDILNLLIGFSSVIAVLMIIISGYIIMTSTGEPDKVDRGRKTLIGSVIGLAIVWIAGLVIMQILKALNIE